MNTVEAIIKTVPKDSTSDLIRPLARLSKEATSCCRYSYETIESYVEYFVIPAQVYLNLTDADSQSAESQSFAIILLLNANLSHQTYSPVMSSLVLVTMIRSDNAEKHISVHKEKLERVDSLLQQLHSSDSFPIGLAFVNECMKIWEMALERKKIEKSDL